MDDDNPIIRSGSLRDSTASITSSILEYRHINGRPFQQSKTTEYWAPTDDEELEHTITFILKTPLHTAAIRRQASSSSHQKESLAFVPPNCSFQIDDAQLDWTFKPDELDFIHIRYLYGAIDDWKKLYRQAYTHVRPGGWVKSFEIDIETHSENPKIEKDEGHIFKKWCKLFFECGRKTDRTWEIARDGRQEEYMREAGFTDEVSKSWKLPVGGWPQDKKLKQIGLYNGAFIDHYIDAFAIFPIGEILGRSKAEVTVLVSQMRKALKEPRALPYFNV
ncbi:s-adenosyl-l-methionine-dependent methyltransferase [Fusarium mundagurra]|uniref:S-adenosyl-l-methionine-dependent methyltransferase n=1 Tax=Fusarium mundagurra TaxID=1567541 RepID=A0A8H5YP69_9HYPO|nr:s-adenosyl-l-methionine-dependent methyltransferase [Fusarium mundagurra]